jgi:hypothetical protein
MCRIKQQDNIRRETTQLPDAIFWSRACADNQQVLVSTHKLFQRMS